MSGWAPQPLVGAGLPRETGTAVHGTGFAGVRGASPLLQGILAPCARSSRSSETAQPARLRSDSQLSTFSAGNHHGKRLPAHMPPKRLA
ncbi:hypothetical protein F3J44_02565 [Pantoea sp. Tr-811]|nr:hypothetical protein [Pantoea sp. Tr-811]